MARLASMQRPVPRRLVALVWMGVAFLLIIGISAAALRATHFANVYGLIATWFLVSTVRLFVMPIDLTLTPLGVGPEVVFLNAFWMGWIVAVLTAEWWIRRTRPGRASVA